jgi:4-hydroxybenzoate polyprenyltransferase
MVTFCLSLFNSGWWWFACVPAAFVVFICIMVDEISAKNKKCQFFYVYLSILQAFSCLIDNNSYLACGVFCGSLFFPLIYSFPKTVSLLTIFACGVLAVEWTGWWWIGVPIFLVVLFCIWAEQDDKKKESDSNVADQK